MTGPSNRSFRARILLLDDNTLGLSARKSVLEELGHEIVATSSPHEALELCAQRSFDVVVTDYRMPSLNGVEFISRLREQGIRVPVVLVSGFTDTLGLNEENTGADVVIQKSNHEVTHLVRAVTGLLRRPVDKKPPGSQGPGATGKRKSRK